MNPSPDTTDERTIADFGQQWNRYVENLGYYGSVDCLEDIFEPLLHLSDASAKRVGDIGSGSGRIVNMLLDAGAASLVAVEPSDAFHVLEKNVAGRRDRVTLIHGTGEEISAATGLDLIVSIGVLHHIVDPGPVMKAAYGALKPGGTILVWLYGVEGNETYLRWVEPLRRVTKRLPHVLLSLLCSVLNLCLDVYILAARHVQVPMREYVTGHLSKLDRAQRKLTIYDQLNPAYAKYYSRQEAQALLENNGFGDVELHHRHGYSWTVKGTRPA